MKLENHHSCILKFKSVILLFSNWRTCIFSTQQVFNRSSPCMSGITCYTEKYVMGNVTGETWLCLPPPSPHQQLHCYSHIHVPHLSNQILGCVHSAVAIYMNYKPAYTYFENSPFLSTGIMNMKTFCMFILFHLHWHQFKFTDTEN